MPRQPKGGASYNCIEAGTSRRYSVTWTAGIPPRISRPPTALPNGPSSTTKTFPPTRRSTSLPEAAGPPFADPSCHPPILRGSRCATVWLRGHRPQPPGPRFLRQSPRQTPPSALAIALRGSPATSPPRPEATLTGRDPDDGDPAAPLHE